MKVACPSCNSSLTIDDKKIPAGGARIKCPTCQNIFPVKPGSATSAVPLPGGAAAESQTVPLPGLSAARPATAASWEEAPTRAAPTGIPLPGAAKPMATDWESEPTRNVSSSGVVPLPGSSIPGASPHAPPPTNVPAPPRRPPMSSSASQTVPLPGLSATRPSSPNVHDEATRIGEANPGSTAADFDASSTIPLPGGSASGLRTNAVPLPGSSPSGSVPLPGSSASGMRTAAVPLPGSSPSGMRTAAVPLPGSSPSGLYSDAVPLPGSGSGVRSSPSAARGAVPLPGSSPSGLRSAPTAAVPLPGNDDFASDAATQAVPALSVDEVPFSDDFGEAPAPVAAPSSFAFPEVPESGPAEPGFDPPMSSAPGAFDFDAPAPAAAPGSFDFDAPAPPPAAAPGAFDFDAPAPAPAAAPGAFDFDAPPAAAPTSFDFAPAEAAPAAGGFDFNAPPAAAPGGFDFQAPPAPAAPAGDDLAFDFNAPAAPQPAPSFGEVDFGAPAGAAPNDLEFDPTAAPRRADDLEADLSASLPPSTNRAQGPADGLEMLSFIDDTAKDAGAPATGTPVRRFHIKRRSGKVFGPFEEAVIVKMLEEAQLLGNEEVSVDGENWQPIGSESSFQAVIARLMEAPARASTHQGLPVVEDKPKGPSMEKLKQLYEGRMAAVAVVESRAPVPFIKRLPYIVAALAAVAVLGAGVFAGVATPYGWFFLKKIFPAKVKPDTREHGYLAQARAGFLKDTYRAAVQARDLSNQALAVKEYPEARAVWNQAVYSLHRKYNAAAPGEVAQADGELTNIELLGEKHIEVLKARAGSALVQKDAESALAVVSEALAREENQDDLELLFLRAEAYLVKKAIGQADGEYQAILKKNPKSARALHALGVMKRQKNEIDLAIAQLEAALAADPDHVSSGIELAELLLVVKKEKEKGEALLTTLLTKEKKAEMAPAELGKALALQGEALVVEQKLADALPVFEEALKADPKNSFTQGRLARVLVVMNQPEKALPLFRDAVASAPDNLDYAEGYLSTLIALGKMDEASKAMASANARFPGNAMLSYLSGRVADAVDDSKTAEDGYKRAIAADPLITDAYLYLSRLYVRFRRYNDALPILEQGLEKDPKKAELHVGMGELAAQERNIDRAETEFKQAAELNPHSSEAYRGLSRVALEKNKPDLALAHIEKALEINPRLQGGRLQKGNALWKLQRLAEAVDELEQARAEEPRNTQVIVTLGAVKFEQGQLQDALNSLASALQAEPGHADANFYMARVKNASRDHSQAIEAIKRALESDPKNPVYHYWSGRVLADAKKSDEAIAEFKTAIEINPRYADALETLGRIYVDRNQLKQAVDAFTKALEVDPGRNTARAATGDAYMKLEDWDGAIAVYTEAIEADPDNKDLIYVYTRLASAYQEKGPRQYKKAVEWYQKAAKVDPEAGEAYKNLGYLLKDLKKPTEAVAAWEKYLAVSKDDDKTKKVVADDLDDLKKEK